MHSLFCFKNVSFHNFKEKIEMQPLPKKTTQRFNSKIFPEPNTGCWLWGGSLKLNGHGTFSIYDRHYAAHKIAYFIANDKWVSAILIQHKCNNVLCMNPEHLTFGAYKVDSNYRKEYARKRYRLSHPVKPKIVKVESTKKRLPKSAIIEKPITTIDEKIILKINSCLRRKLINRTKDAFRRFYRKLTSAECEQVIGGDINRIRMWIERQFNNGMRWDISGTPGRNRYETLHLDHKTPLSSADIVEELIVLCHYTNIQPLWGKDNIKKGGVRKK